MLFSISIPIRPAANIEAGLWWGQLLYKRQKLSQMAATPFSPHILSWLTKMQSGLWSFSTTLKEEFCTSVSGFLSARLISFFHFSGTMCVSYVLLCKCLTQSKGLDLTLDSLEASFCLLIANWQFSPFLRHFVS